MPSDNSNVDTLTEFPSVETTAALTSGAQAAHQRAMKERAIGALGKLPPFPVVLNRLLASLAGEDIPFVKIGELIEKDTVISGNLLHLVNSAVYARRGTVNSVRHALSLLGVEKVRNAVLGMSITRMWNKIQTPPSWSMARFNLHSAAVATLADCLAQRLPVSYGEGAFVAGLLHDLGTLLIAFSLPEEYQIIRDLHEDTGQPIREIEVARLGLSHEELSGEALLVWNLPAPIRDAVRFHHDPCADTSATGEGEVRLSRVVCAANDYVNSTGVSIIPGGIPGGIPGANMDGEGDRTLLESLGLDPDQAQAAVDEFNAEREGMAQLLR